MEQQLASIYKSLIVLASTWGIKLLGVIALLIIGSIVIRCLKKALAKVLENRNIEKSLHSFLLSLTGVLLWALVLISAAGMLGIKTTSFVALLGAGGLAVGLALQGSLSNFAGGVLILLFKPFKVGDYISAQGVEGEVKEIQIFHTVLCSLDNKKLIVPNGPLSNGNIENFTAEETRRLDFKFGVSYSTDLDTAEKIIRDTLAASQYCLSEPTPVVAVSEHADSAVVFTVLVWSKTADYWACHFDVPGKVKKAFDQNKIEIPFPQMDLHMIPQT